MRALKATANNRFIYLFIYLYAKLLCTGKTIIIKKNNTRDK